MTYITVPICKFDKTKLSFGPDPRSNKNGSLALLYEGKLLTLSFDDGVSGKDKNLLFSYNGPVKNEVWDAKAEKFIKDSWDGTFGISFQISKDWKTMKPFEKKIIETIDAMKAVVEGSEDLKALYGEFKCEPIYRATFVKKEIAKKIRKTTVVDETKPIYLPMKCNYGGLKVGDIDPETNSPIETVKGKNGKDEPAHKYRKLATPFYHPIKGQADPEKILKQSLKGMPEAFVAYSCVNKKHYISLYMNSCYYVPVAVNANRGPDASKLASMVGISDEADESGNNTQSPNSPQSPNDPELQSQG